MARPSLVLGKKAKSKIGLLDTTQRNNIKEKPYTTKAIDSSIAILDSPEDDVVLEALLHLSKYVDHQVNNLNFDQRCTLLHKLLNLCNRNDCILRLSLRLTGILLNLSDIIAEIDQDIYDEKILKIGHMYVSYTDTYIKQFCAEILSKLAGSCRITCLLFKIDLINPILEIIQKTTDMDLLEHTLVIFYKFLNAPAALGFLPEMYNFDMSILLMHLENPEKRIARLAFEIIERLTFYCLEVFQKMFRENKLMESMLDLVMKPEKKDFHKVALDIITNSMHSEETSNYFIESLEFLKFCEWVKTCEPQYIFPSINILERLSRIPSRRQTLFDKSVEDSILYCLRSTEKRILNKTCEAISNMTTHRYCCERMLTPVVVKELFAMLVRTDEEDPGNEVAMQTILNFSRRNVTTINMIYAYGLYNTLLHLFKKSGPPLSERNLLAILEILYKIAVHPLYQQDIVDVSFFQKLLYLFQSASEKVATFVCEILTNFVCCVDFKNTFLAQNGPQIFVGALQTSKNPNLLKSVLLFIYSTLTFENMVRNFLQNNLVIVLKELPLNMKSRAPIIDDILNDIYNFHLPLKLFEMNKLAITDKFSNKFYLITGPWRNHFPFLEILEAIQMSTIHTIYVVDYTLEVTKNSEEQSIASEQIPLLEKASSEKTVLSATVSKSGEEAETHVHINYGKLSEDIYLPRYIYHIAKYIEEATTMEEKVRILADYVDTLLCGPKEEYTMEEKVKAFNLHIDTLKKKLGTNLIPIGFLRLGFYCERALLFKAIADRCGIPTSLVKGRGKLYWNEIALFNHLRKDDTLKIYVVDLMNHVGTLLLVGSRAANQYCKLEL